MAWKIYSVLIEVTPDGTEIILDNPWYYGEKCPTARHPKLTISILEIVAFLFRYLGPL